MRISRHVLLCVVAAIAVGCGDDGGDGNDAATAPPPPTATATEPEPTQPPDRDSASDRDLARTSGAEPRVSTIAEGLEVPWEIAFLPDGRALITERGGTVRLLDAAGELLAEPAGRIEVEATGEGGLLGLAVDPEFEGNGFVYAYRTASGGNEVLRLRFAGGRLTEEATVLDGIQASAIHDGGRLRFGPDDLLYATTGDAAQPDLAQQDGRNGKILRLGPRAFRGDGGTPAVISTGHRNPQGIAWQPDSDRLVATEHGPSGQDEVNVIQRGANYGWPEVEGSDHGDFRAPAALYEQSIAPSGATFVTLAGSSWTGDLLFGGLVGEQIRRVSFDGASVSGQEVLFAGRYGRIRSVVEGPDGALYALTNNTDGRGSPRDGDDRVLRIVPPAR